MNSQNKPRPHAELIHAWADGKTIQIRLKESQEKWKDLPDSGLPLFNDIHFEYRIRPEWNEPWIPKKGEKYFFLDVIDGEFSVRYHTWNDDEIDHALYSHNNIFHTEEDAKDAIPRVEATLKGDFSKGINVPTNVGSEIDGLTLTCGEIELIKALRNAGGIYEVFKFEKTLLVANRDNGAMSVLDGHVAFVAERGGARSIAIIRALKQIKSEQEAGNEA